MMSLRTKLILWYSGLLGVFLLVVGVGVFSVMRWTLISTVDNTLEKAIEYIALNSRAPGTVDTNMELPSLNTLDLSSVLVQVWSGPPAPPELLDSSSNIEDHHAPLDPSALNAPMPESGVLFTTVTMNDIDWRVLTRYHTLWGHSFIIQAAHSAQTVKETTGALVAIMLTASVASLLGSLVLGMWLSARAVQPINQIAAAADSIVATDDLKTRLSWDGPMDELGQLIAVFNHMMERLERLFSVQQRFVADVSHELRTPLTAMRGNIDLMKRYGPDQESMDAIESEVDRMARLVSDLLMLARADYGGLTLELEPIDLDDVVNLVYREARLLVKERELTVKVSEFEPVRIAGNGDWLKQLLLNLVNNALKFTPDGGTITLSLRQEGTEALISVSDTGVGISPEDQPRIFDRFFQSDLSRTREAAKAGVGLGLAIARWVVEAHYGRIEVKSALGQGTTFTVRLPVLNPNQAATRQRSSLPQRRPSSGSRPAVIQKTRQDVTDSEDADGIVS